MNPPHAKKSLGQHFLRSAEVIRRIIELIQPEPADRILEIGPGPGALTQALRAWHPASLLLIEKDDHWAAHHAELCPEDGSERVIHGDALAFPWEELTVPWKIAGNLPYNVASPLMWDIVSRTPALVRAVFMVQKEVAERLYARPGGRDYGALSVWIQSFVDVKWGFTVGPGNFSPPPKVDSAVVVFLPLQEKVPFSAEALSRTLKLCFGQRRKQLQGILRRQGVQEAECLLKELNIDPAARPEALPPEKFRALSAKLLSLHQI